MPFMDENFLLKTETAGRLYHGYAKKLPIIDYHCHVSPEEIAADRRYGSVSELLLGGDHYKWRLMRANGTPESEITGAREQDPWLLFQRFAEALPRAAGNPVYHWTHLELKRYFGVETPLTPATAREIYDACNKKLAAPDMSVRGIIAKSNVKVICTTDDPADDLRWHRELALDSSFGVAVLPAFRPDKAVNPDAPGFAGYIEMLSRASGVKITDFNSLCAALEKRLDYFNGHGCRVSDHALNYCVYAPAAESELDLILQTALSGGGISPDDADKYRTAALLFLGRRYSALGWVMQLHFGCMRNLNGRMFAELGPDTGFDAMNGDGRPQNLACFLNALDASGELPRMICYSLNPAENGTVTTILGCFSADAGCPGKLQTGAPWWFLDTKSGMEKHLLDYANNSLLGNFIGMLTDSRSFLSYTRHEYFRRILCNFLGRMAEDGEYPGDCDALGGLVEDICYNNAARFFGFKL